MLRQMRALRSIDEIARQGSIRRAAERLAVAPSVVQRRLADVEADLGVLLFERLQTGMRPTSAGEVLLAWIRRQSAEFDQVRSQIEDIQGMQFGAVRIACSQALAAGFLQAEVKRFRQRYKKVAFHVSVESHGRAFEALAAYEIDLALVFRPRLVAGVSVLARTEQRLCAVMAATHPLATRPEVRLRDCAGYPAALLDENFVSREIINALLAGTSTALNVALESNSFEMLSQFVMDTDAITFQIEAGLPADAALATRPVVEAERISCSLVLAKMEGRALPVAADAFARQIAGRLNAGELWCTDRHCVG